MKRLSLFDGACLIIVNMAFAILTLTSLGMWLKTHYTNLLILGGLFYIGWILVYRATVKEIMKI